jgi:hypothetical protein
MRMSLILAATLALTGTAFAQMAPMTPTGGQFCARGDSGTNKGIETCSFQTMAQCEAAKGPGEKCFPNAQLKSESKAVGTAAPKAAAGSDKMKSAAGAPKSKSTTGSGAKN